MNEKNVSLSDFTLEKVKLTKTGGVEAKYDVLEREENNMRSYKVLNSAEAHAELKSHLSDLKPIAVRVFGLAGTEYSIESIDVCGVSKSGQGENEGAVIVLNFTAENGLSTTLKTPRIKLDSNIFGIEEKLRETINSIETEVYFYLFAGKQAKVTVFGE